MRLYSWLVALVALFAVVATSCEPTPEPGPGTSTDAAFEIELNEVTATYVNFDVTPSSEDIEYYVDIYDKIFVDAFSKDEHIVGTLYDELSAYAGTKGKTLNEYLAENTFTGTMTDVEFTGLAPESEYYLLVFAVDAANDYALVGSIEKQAFTTSAMPTLEVEFDVTTEVYYNTVTFDVKPSDKNAYWHLITVPQAMLDSYKTGNGWTESEFYFEYMKNELSQYQGAGYSTAQIMAAMFPTGDKKVTGRGLVANAEYVYLVAAVIIENGEIIVGMEPVKGNFETEEALPSSMVFNIEVSDIEAVRAAIRVAPSVNNETFVWRVGEWDGDSDAVAVMNDILAVEGQWLNNGYGVSMGVQDYTGGPGSPYKYRLDAPDTDYYVIAFGYAGGVTTAPQMATFRTAYGGDPAEATFTMTASKEHTYGFTLAVTVDNPNIYYTLDVIDPTLFDETTITEEWNEFVDESYAEYCKQNPGKVSMASFLRALAYSGNISSVDASVVPDTEVMGYVLALDAKTGHVVKCHTFPSLARTKSQSSYEPTVELVGYYSGDEEAGTLFGEPEVSAGKAILVYKFDNFDDAKALYVYYDLGNAMSEADHILANTGSWRAFTALGKPYDFAVGDWNAEYTAAVYALNDKGEKSRLARLLMRPTADEKQPIENLIELYNELYGSKTSAVPASLVIKAEEEVAPVATGIIPAKVEEPKEVAAKRVALSEILILNDIVRIPCGR